MQTVKLEVESRETSGKGPARQMRLAGKVPANFYGRGVKNASLAVSPKALRVAVSGEMGVNSLLGLTIDGKEHACLLSEFQIHPVTRDILHVDFRKVEADRKVNVEVPLVFSGKPKGIVLGGKLRQVFGKVPVRCLPSQIPAQIEHDVTPLLLEDIVRVRDLSLPEGVEVRYRETQTLGGVYGNKKKAEEAEAAAAEADAAAAKKK